MTYMTTIESMAAQLNALDVPMTEEQTIGRIIASLPDEYQNFETAWDSKANSEKTLENLRSRLVQEEKKHKRKRDASRMRERDLQPPRSDQEALLSSTNHKSNNQFRVTNRNSHGGPYYKKDSQHKSNSDIPTCNYCKKKWHTKDDCRFKNRDHKPQSPNKKAKLANTSTYKVDYSFISSTCLQAFRNGKWIADSGASEHLTDQRSSFLTFTPVQPGSWHVNGVGNTKFPVLGRGSVAIKIYLEDGTHDGTLHNVLYVPNLGGNLLSLGAVADHDFGIYLTKSVVQLQRAGRTFMRGTRDHHDKNLYYMDISTVHQPLPGNIFVPESTSSFAAAATAKKSAGERTIDEWHKSLAHVDHRIIQRMEREEAVTGLKIKPTSRPLEDCKPCDQGKMTRRPFSLGRRRGEFVGDRIHADLVGPLHVQTPKGARYYLILKDDLSTFKEAFFLKTKDEAPDCIKGFIAKTERETGNKVISFRGENDGVFFSNDLCKWFFDRGIQQESSVPYTPQKNGVAERDNRTTVEAMRTELHAKDLPLHWWAEAVSYSVYTSNRLLSSTIRKTPFELYYKRKPDIAHMQEFGANVRVHIPDHERRKLDAKCHDGIFLGYCTSQDGYRNLDTVDNKIRISRDVKFLKVSFSPAANDNLDDAPARPTTDTAEIDTSTQTAPLRRSSRGRVPKRQWPGDADPSPDSDLKEGAPRLLTWRGVPSWDSPNLTKHLDSYIKSRGASRRLWRHRRRRNGGTRWLTR